MKISIPFCALLALSLWTATARAADAEYEELIWVDLLPLEDLQALLNPPPVLHFGDEENGSSQILRRNENGEFQGPGESDFEKALVSTNVKPEMNDKLVRLPGFVVPLEYGENGRVTEFFLVPFFGACIHVPPPPPNQIVYISYPAGLELGELWDAFDVSGKMTTEVTNNATALAAYKIEAHAITLYEEDEYVEEEDEYVEDSAE